MAGAMATSRTRPRKVPLASAMGEPRRAEAVVLLFPCLDIRRCAYQTLHAFALTMGCPALQLKAAANSGMLATIPLIRAKPGEWGSVTAWRRRLASRVFSQAHWAKPMKKR